MNYQDKFQKLSEHYDIDSISESILEEYISDPILKKAFDNMPILSKILKSSYENSFKVSEEEKNQFYNNLEKRIKVEEKELNNLLQKSLGQLPEEYENYDLWANIEGKLDTEEIQQKYKIQEKSKQDIDIEEIDTEFISKKAKINTYLKNNWEKILKETSKLPEKIENYDLWAAINKELDSLYHEELFTESDFAKELTAKEKYYIGVSEYIDGECSSEKSQQLTEHLLECPPCRTYYLAQTKIKKALQYTFKQSENKIEEQTMYIWENIDQELFPEQQITHRRISKSS